MDRSSPPPAPRWWLAFALAIAACRPCEAAPAPRDLAADLELGAAWLELAPSCPFKLGNGQQELVLHHSDGLTLTRPKGGAPGVVYSPKLGSLIRLDVEVVGSDGSIEPLAMGGISPGEIGMRRADSTGRPELEVTRLRLRSDPPLTVSKVEWRVSAD